MEPKIITKEERAARKKCNTCGKKVVMNNENKLPSNWQMFKNLVHAAKEAVASGLDVRGPEDVEKALKICIECPRLVNDDGWLRCGECGCGIGFSTENGIKPAKLGKLALKAWSCPIAKW